MAIKPFEKPQSILFSNATTRPFAWDLCFQYLQIHSAPSHILVYSTICVADFDCVWFDFMPLSPVHPGKSGGQTSDVSMSQWIQVYKDGDMDRDANLRHSDEHFN